MASVLQKVKTGDQILPFPPTDSHGTAFTPSRGAQVWKQHTVAPVQEEFTPVPARSAVPVYTGQQNHRLIIGCLDIPGRQVDAVLRGDSHRFHRVSREGIGVIKLVHTGANREIHPEHRCGRPQQQEQCKARIS
ncbi:MAG: hypothetical protein BWX80_04063 [Candidatus Hydrogenedentes bacterium ADurb.Bin101]|nr:MAG: hypothetical protein BWX80_04063 [Candidatus Hydrogenedentes bacterium ADurb.Bin101]